MRCYSGCKMLLSHAIGLITLWECFLMVQILHRRWIWVDDSVWNSIQLFSNSKLSSVCKHIGSFSWMAVLLLLTFAVEDVSLRDPQLFCDCSCNSWKFFTLLNLMGVYYVFEYIKGVLFKTRVISKASEHT